MLTRLPERPFRPADPRTANRAFQQRRQFDRATPLSDRGDFGAAFWARAGQNTPLVGAGYPQSPSLGSGGAARRPRRNSQHIVRRIDDRRWDHHRPLRHRRYDRGGCGRERTTAGERKRLRLGRGLRRPPRLGALHRIGTGAAGSCAQNLRSTCMRVRQYDCTSVRVYVCTCE